MKPFQGSGLFEWIYVVLLRTFSGLYIHLFTYLYYVWMQIKNAENVKENLIGDGLGGQDESEDSKLDQNKFCNLSSLAPRRTNR